MSRHVCVTGASGFLGSRVVQELLREGCAVTAIVRREGASLRPPRAAEGLYRERVIHLERADSCDGAFADCDAVVHCAARVTSDARPGSRVWKETLNCNIGGTEAVLRGVRRAPRVRTLVFTSSMAAVLSTGRPPDHRFDEADWNDAPLESSDPYWFSKTAAERLLTEAFERDGGTGCRLVRINPSVIIGPVDEVWHASSSLAIIDDLYTGRIPACPDLSFYFVDVRDVAQVHVRAVLDDTVRGRFILPGAEATMIGLAETIRRHFPESRAPHRRAPDWLTYLAAVPSGRVSLRYLRRNLGVRHLFDDARARAAFALRYRPLEQTIVDTIASLKLLAR